MINKYIDSLKNDIILQTQKLIQIPSVYSVSKNPYKPFGENINTALEYILKLGESLGFRTKNIDGYCGYIEFGEGEQLLGIIGHLDVVPEGENWTFPPFQGVINDGKIYGRGAIDDKGPVIASLYAMKSIMDNFKIKSRVRLILGLNEENDWKCINYYKEHEESPAFGFSPDADFPCIYAEKGVLNSYIEMDYSNYLNSNIVIKEINCNNNALNVVPKFCSVNLKINQNLIFMKELIDITKTAIEKYEFEIDIYQLNDFEIKLSSYGKQAHAAHPDLGINAISRLMIVLNEILNCFNSNIPVIKYFAKYFSNEYNGEQLGINFKDESGMLTLNVGNVSLQENKLSIGLNIRVPVHTKLDEVETNFEKSIDDFTNNEKYISQNIDSNVNKEIVYTTHKYSEPLYIPKDNPLIQKLCNIYNEMTNSNEEPIAIGGATYARAFKNCVSFGANFPKNKDMCHQTDEFISIDNLILSTKIYAKTINETVGPG